MGHLQRPSGPHHHRGHTQNNPMHTIPRGQPAGSDTQLKIHIGGFAVSWARHTGVVEPSGARGQSAPRRAGSQVTSDATQVMVQGAVPDNDLQDKRAENKTAQAFDQAGMDPETTETFVSLLAGCNLVMSLLALAVSGLILWSGLQMRQLKGRGLAIAGSILGMLPCFTGCCCVIGLPVGIWALVVLMNNEVKAAFEGQQG